MIRIDKTGHMSKKLSEDEKEAIMILETAIGHIKGLILNLLVITAPPGQKWLMHVPNANS